MNVMASNVSSHPLQESDSDEDNGVNNEKASLLETSSSAPRESGPSSHWRRG